MKLKFKKYHSCGNDFVVVNQTLSLDAIRHCCNRRYGVGADGILIIKNIPLTMEMYNQDGSRANMCGNGLRCFIHAAYEDKLITKKTVVKLNVGAIKVSIDNIEPFISSFFMPVIRKEENLFHVHEVRHYVVEGTYDEFKALALYQQKQVNINFLSIINNHTILVETYERGVGKTNACSTGASACVFYAFQKGYISEQCEVQFIKDKIVAYSTFSGVVVSGISHFVYEGEIDIEN